MRASANSDHPVVWHSRIRGVTKHRYPGKAKRLARRGSELQSRRVATSVVHVIIDDRVIGCGAGATGWRAVARNSRLALNNGGEHLIVGNRCCPMAGLGWDNNGRSV